MDPPSALPQRRRLAVYIKSLDPQLPRAVWILQAGGLANAFGNGIVIPFVLIYLHTVRGIPLGVVGLIAATNALAALLATPVAGSLADRLGPRTVLIGSLLLMAAAYVCYPLIRHPWQAFLFSGMAGLGGGGFRPSQFSLLSILTPPERRHAAFSQQFVTANLGLGLGGLVAGLIASTSNPASFTILFVLDAATFLIFVMLLLTVPSPPRFDPATQTAGTYREVLRDRVFLRFSALNLVFVVAGVAPSMALIPVFANNQAAVSTRGIGLIYLVNTVLIVVAQLPISKLQEGRRRMTAFALTGALWALSWIIVWAAGEWLRAGSATVVLALALALFGVGECLHSVVQGPLIADLSGTRLRGRYMGISGFAWQMGFIIGPAVGGFTLAANPLALWPIMATLCLAAGGYALLLERSIPVPYRRTPGRQVPPEVEEEAVPPAGATKKEQVAAVTAEPR